ncbi:TRAP transporter large permease subunit [Ruegeria pomeroyi]|uniref:TRAP transporter large permease protein n=2 Tax=Ruegeria pomeroyi TaxID=89184 RepID=Q5LTF1_RUEPO|nr:TRAP transporter large permease subunit [Ruegeria pomeroyi]HCE72604.1 C4-dicarboxylate ABC transporter permease [Ruegeria sp.]AAV94750.1 TRAP dicarboxylate transporter, DctM subunit [Ruegeria pomeroyi DSS-3]NVK95880.1 TRAP transporter large permease subunit [Ruegeria pomeroyi]NVL00141.1 TRAP transporter large permease subunit [Ruegeria pomeroyi]QWV08330.1 TRAP transporter large permease subunit [Ruegeria pomeroyi]
MEWYEALVFLLGMILFFMALGVPVALAFLAANMIGAAYFMGGRGDIASQMARGIGQLANNAIPTVTSFNLMPVPMFLLMGEIFFFTGLANRMFGAVDRLMGKLPARLSFVTVAGGTAFATLSGSSMGSTALLGSLMVPEMQKRGYKKHMAIGPILGTGGLAMLIPPSALAVLLATLAELDIGDLLIAGIMPGLMLAIFYAVMILGMALYDPSAAPAYEVESSDWVEKLRLLFVDILPMVSIVIGVILVIMFGIATPSESAAFGCLGVIVLAALYRSLTWEGIVKSVAGALKVTTMALLIIFGSATFSALLAFSGASSGLIRWATGFDLEPITMLLIMFGILLVLGMFMDQLSMMLLTVPIFFPLAQTLGFDLIWFGVIVLLALEISFTTPPFGLLLFVMKGVSAPGTSMRDIYVSALPFIGCSMLLVALLIIFPGIALWLPGLGQ